MQSRCRGWAPGAEMEPLLDVALTFEQQQSDGFLQHQQAFEASAGAVVPVAVGPRVGAALMTSRLDVVGFRNTVKTRFADFFGNSSGVNLGWSFGSTRTCFPPLQ